MFDMVISNKGEKLWNQMHSVIYHMDFAGKDWAKITFTLFDIFWQLGNMDFGLDVQ